MNISLTLNFDSVGQLESFMANRTSNAGAVPIAAVALKAVPDAVVETPPGAVDDPMADMGIDPMDMGEAIAQEEEAIDYDKMRVDLMSKLKGIAGGMDDPSLLGKFINAFDVQKFSDLPDDRLEGFSNALTAEFG